MKSAKVEYHSFFDHYLQLNFMNGQKIDQNDKKKSPRTQTPSCEIIFSQQVT